MNACCIGVAALGLTDAQVQRTLNHRAHIPGALKRLSRGELRILHGPLGSGKSDIVEEWFRSIIAAATADAAAAIPIWITIDDLGAALETHILGEVGCPRCSSWELMSSSTASTNTRTKAASLTRQAGEFVKKWPSSRILLTTRSPEFVSEELC